MAVIGLGRFGSRLAVNLAASGQEVIAIDRDLAAVDRIRDRVTLAIAMDATDEESLRLHGLDQVHAAVVAIGADFESTTLVTVLLKQLGVPRVVSRALTATSARILSRIGADEVVNPQEEAADRWCSRLISPNFLNQFMLDAEHSVVELRPPEAWQGKPLATLQLRQSARVNVLAVKRLKKTPGSPDVRHVELPAAGTVLTKDDVVVIMGRDQDLEALSS